VISDEHVAKAEELVRQVFTTGEITPEELPARLEQALGLGRNSWPLSVIRRLTDEFLELSDGRKRNQASEVRWLNLCGFCLRPGFGFPGDEFRMEKARRIYASGLQFANQVQNEIDWWIFWGRVAGGLNRNQQVDIFQRLSPTLLPRANKKVRVNSSLLREMWRAASSLELLPVGTKTDLGEGLMKRIAAKDYRESELWCLSRLGARQLFYGPINLVLPPTTVARWVEKIVKLIPEWPQAAEAAAAMARRTGDATRDLPPATIELVRGSLAAHSDAQKLLAILEGEELADQALGRIFGEDLPSGLRFGAPEPAATETTS
jgi:hypothetical protein